MKANLTVLSCLLCLLFGRVNAEAQQLKHLVVDRIT